MVGATENRPFTDQFAEEFKEAALRKRRPGAWTQVVSKLPPKITDQMMAVVALTAWENSILLTPNQLVFLTDQFDQLRLASGINPADQTIDYQNLAKFFLIKKGLIRQPPTQPGKISRRKVLGATLATGATAAAWELRPRRYASLLSKSKEATATATPTEAPTPEVNNFNDLIAPLVNLAVKRRGERARSDPEYYHRVDKELNSTRINISLVTWAEGHGESLTVLSYNLATGKWIPISCTRETITPEVIRLNKQHNPNESSIYKADFSTNMFLFNTGLKYGSDRLGFELVRRVIEDETGLSADVVMYMDETAVHGVIKNVLGDSVEIEVKDELQLNTPIFSSQYGKAEDFTLKPGRHRMNADQAMRFILSSDTVLKEGKGNQPPGRKRDLFKSIMGKGKALFRQDLPGTVVKGLTFLGTELVKKEVIADFDLVGLLKELAGRAAWAGARGKSIPFPEMENDDLMLNDEYFGDGGMIRVHRFIDANNQPSDEYYKYAHPSVQRLVDQTIEIINKLHAEGTRLDDIEKGLDKKGVVPTWLQVPINGDINAADLVSGYWQSTRKLVKTKLQPI